MSVTTDAAASGKTAFRRGPDKLDRPLRVSTSLAGLAFAVLLVCIAAAVGWSFVATAPIKIAAQGILLSKLGVLDVSANAAGRITALKVAVGDRVTAGQAVAEIGQPELGDTLQSKLMELASRRAEQEQQRQLTTRTDEAADRQRAMRRQAIDVRLVSLAQRLATTREIEAGTASLFASGVTTRMRLLDVTNDRSRTENDLNDARSQLLSLQAEAEEQQARDDRESLKAQIAVDGAERAIAVVRASLSRADVVTAPASGTVVEINVNNGEQVQPGVALLRMLPGEDGPKDLQAVIYVAGGGGKRVQPGMEVQVVPATARQQRDGYIEGRVTGVADLPATRESILRVLKNAAFVDQLMQAGPPYQATVALATDPKSPSGFRWSTGVGPATPIQVGTLVSAKIVVDRVPVISLVVPRAETLISALHRWMPGH